MTRKRCIPELKFQMNGKQMLLRYDYDLGDQLFYWYRIGAVGEPDRAFDVRVFISQDAWNETVLMNRSPNKTRLHLVRDALKKHADPMGTICNAKSPSPLMARWQRASDATEAERVQL